MKKNITKFIIMILLIIVFNFNSPINVFGSENGDLKCPSNFSTNCVETIENGKVTKTTVTASDDNIEMHKYVEKTDKPGKVKVWFDIKVKTELKKIAPSSTYVVVLYDTSGSQKDNIDNAKEAIIKFSEDILNINSNYNLAFVQFATKISNNANVGKFDNKVFNENYFCDYNSCGMETKSNVEVALEKAYNLLNNIESDNKYVVLFGDGQYMFTPNSDYVLMQNYLDKLKDEIGAKIRVIRYPAKNDENEPTGQRLGLTKTTQEEICKFSNDDLDNDKKIDNVEYSYVLKKGVSTSACNKKIINDLFDNDPIEAPNPENYSDAFKGLFNKINGELLENSVSGTLVDNVGRNFSYYVDLKWFPNYIKEFKDLEKDKIYTSDEFYLELNTKTDGWFPTNDGFSFTYSTDGTNITTLKSNVNPLVYWKFKKELTSCSGGSKYINAEYGYEEEKTTAGINWRYGVHCNDGTYNYSSSANIQIGKVEKGVHELNLSYGGGFSALIDMYSEIKCEYYFSFHGVDDPVYYSAFRGNVKKNKYIGADVQEYISHLKHEIEYADTDYEEEKCDEIYLKQDEYDAQREELEKQRKEFCEGLGKSNVEKCTEVLKKMSRIPTLTDEVKQCDAIKRAKSNNTNLKNNILNNLESVFSEVNSIIERPPEIYEYMESFLKPPILTVKYNNTKLKDDETELMSSGDNQWKLYPVESSDDENSMNYVLDVSDTKKEQYHTYKDSTITIDDKEYVFPEYRRYNLTLRKQSILKNSCLSMYGGGITSCDTKSKTLINGGRKFYPQIDTKGGYISVTIPNAVFMAKYTENNKDLSQSHLDVTLIGDAKSDGTNYDCKYNMSDNNNIFRQVELSDPFNQSYKKNRPIGDNWLDTKYNFVNVITEDDWNGDYKYQFSISKKDIESIKSNTSNVGVNSYLGRECQFGSNNKFICPFVHQSADNNGSSNYFTKIDIK